MGSSLKREKGYYFLEAILIVPILALLVWGGARLLIEGREIVRRRTFLHTILLLPTLGKTPSTYREDLEKLFQTWYPGGDSSCERDGFTFTCKNPRDEQLSVDLSTPLSQTYEFKKRPFFSPLTSYTLTERGYKLWPW